MKTVWVFGTGRSIGKALVTHFLNRGDAVVSLSRTKSATQSKNLHTRTVDFEDEQATRTTIAELVKTNPPDAAVFCQRYRPSSSASDFESLKRGINVELGPAMILGETVQASARNAPLAMILMTSVAGALSHRDLPLSYHVHKSSLITLARHLSAQSSQINANCIALGEFLKHPLDTYTDQERRKFAALANLSPSGKLTTLEDVVSLVTLLVGQQTLLRGQVFELDGGLSLLAQESIVREGLTTERAQST
jgi:NAD(P)-dependent dehydrogenase (short-subunit alcohol dehydrogenase family)